MGCDDCREAISAELDGEGLPGEAADIAAHLDECADCRWFADRAAYVTRLTRTRAVEPAPDLAAAVMAAAPPVRRRRIAHRGLLVRGGLGAVGVGQVALAVTGVLSAGAAEHQHGTALAGASVAHFAHESSAWNLALAVGFLWAAIGRSRVSGLVPVIGAFVGVLAVLSLLDVLAGRVEPVRLVGHGLVVVGLVLLIVLRRSVPGGGGSASGADPEQPTGRSDRRSPFRPQTWRSAGEGDELAPTAHHRAA
jgi:predicted anti-sigma-YlaC factor YlaD